jgi:hypothetical protein
MSISTLIKCKNGNRQVQEAIKHPTSSFPIIALKKNLSSYYLPLVILKKQK